MVCDEEIASFFHLMIDGIYNKLQIASFNPTLSATIAAHTCILIGGNIPLRGDSVNIFSISPNLLGILIP